MATQVKVTLKALNGNLTPPERTFNLNTDRPTISIGRASKTLSKGLQGAVDNAWFDSPVMSRDHAELSFCTDTKSVRIKDIGSMHGTILAGTSIPRNEYQNIESGNIIVFGAEVRRGTETFPACTFEVTYETLPYKTSNTFAFPDSSDIEDEEEGWDVKCSHDKIDDTGSTLMPSSPRQQKLSQAAEPIDLTGEESSSGSSFHGIDLTRDDGDEPNFSEPVARQHDIDDSHSPRCGYRLDYSSDDSIEDEEGDLDLSDSDASDILEDIGRHPYDYSPDEVLDTEDEESNKSELMDFDQNSFIQGDDRDESSEDSEDSEDDEASHVPELSREFVLHGHTGFYHKALHEETSDPSSLITASVEIRNTPSVMPLPSIINEQAPPQLVMRAPSPSDAAMAKPTDIFRLSTTQLGENVKTATCERSTKEEFFRARAFNKAQFDATKPQQEILSGYDSLSTNSPQITDQERNETIRHSRNRISNRGSVTTLKTSDYETTFLEPGSSSFNFVSSAYRPFPSFLDTVDTVPIQHRDPSPLPDMTSAVKYNESKLSMAAMVDRHGEASPVRSGVTISEIIDNHPAEEGAVTKSLKRKSDAISSTVEEEVRIWGSTSDSSKESFVKAQPLQLNSGNSNTVNSQHTSQPPAKKFKSLMGKVAYAALGGVTVGAALFGGLVATAPDFL